MAISLPYYISESEVNQAFITNVWYEPATTGLGNFSGNSTGNLYQRLNNSGDSFTVILSYDNLRNPVSGASYLIGSDNWVFGIDQSNFYFVKSENESYTFDDINLGQRGCIAFTKNDNAFSVTNFNIPSQKVDSSQTNFFNPTANLTGTGLYIGTGQFISGAKNFWGGVDQLISFNQILSSKTLDTLFSGFLHQTVVTVPGSLVHELIGVNWGATGSLTSGNISFIQSGAQVYANDIFNGLYLNGNYFGNWNLQFGPNYSGFSYINSTSFSILPCNTTATGFIAGHALGNEAGLPSSIGSQVYINLNDDEAFFSFDFSNSIPGLTLSLQYSVEDSQQNFISQNTGYYSGFKMYGTLSENANSLMQGKFNVPFDQVNALGVFDVVKNIFLASGAIPNDRVFLDGLPESGYSISGAYLDIDNIIEMAQNQLIYDKVPQTGIILQYFNTKNFTTGDFFPETSAVFSGDQSFAGMYRIAQANYLETHPYHLYYAKEAPIKPTGVIYNNSDTNWQ